jgi:hypothetical protein
LLSSGYFCACLLQCKTYRKYSTVSMKYSVLIERREQEIYSSRSRSY